MGLGFYPTWKGVDPPCQPYDSLIDRSYAVAFCQTVIFLTNIGYYILVVIYIEVLVQLAG